MKKKIKTETARIETRIKGKEKAEIEADPGEKTKTKREEAD